MRTAHMLQVKRLQAAETRTAAAVYAAAHDWPVYAVASGAMDEPVQAGRDLSVIEWTVLAPKTDAAPAADDVVIFSGDEYAVEGRPKDYTYGPWDHPTAGIVVELRRAEDQ